MEKLGELVEKMLSESRVLKPAIAGLIVDNSVNYKEVFATFVHLVVRGYADCVANRRFVRTGKGVGLCRFEKFVLSEVLPGPEPVEEHEVVSRLKNADLGRFALLLMDELMEQGLSDGKTKLSVNSPRGRISAESSLQLSGGEDGTSIRMMRTKKIRGESGFKLQMGEGEMPFGTNMTKKSLPGGPEEYRGRGDFGLAVWEIGQNQERDYDHEKHIVQACRGAPNAWKRGEKGVVECVHGQRQRKGNHGPAGEGGADEAIKRNSRQLWQSGAG